MKTKNAKTLEANVAVADWTSARTLSITPNGTISLRVTLSCMDCPVCAERAKLVRSALKNSSVPYLWEKQRNPGGNYLVFPGTRARTLKGAVAYVNRALHLGIELL